MLLQSTMSQPAVEATGTDTRVHISIPGGLRDSEKKISKSSRSMDKRVSVFELPQPQSDMIQPSAEAPGLNGFETVLPSVEANGSDPSSSGSPPASFMPYPQMYPKKSRKKSSTVLPVSQPPSKKPCREVNITVVCSIYV